MQKVLLSVVVLIAASAPTADAQACVGSGEVSVTGRIVKAGGFGICMQGETHRIEFTDIYLLSTTIDLTAYENQIHTVCAKPIGVTCNVLNVSKASIPVSQIKWNGVPKPGSTLNFVAGGVPGTAVFMLSPGQSYLPLSPYGTFLLDPVAFKSVAVVPVYQSFSIPIPNDSTLAGLDIYGQAVGLPATGNPLASLTNLIYFQIL